MPIDSSLPQVWVEHDEQAARSIELIRVYLLAVPQGPPVHCPGCGEENPPAFELCWACGAPLPA